MVFLGPGPVFVPFGLDVTVMDLFHRRTVQHPALDGPEELAANEVEEGVASLMTRFGGLVGAVGVGEVDPVGQFRF